MKKKYKHRKIINRISEEKNLDPKLVHLIINKFYLGMRKLMLKNKEINIKGFFIIKLSKESKIKIKKLGKNINLRKRKDQKYTYEKKNKKQ